MSFTQTCGFACVVYWTFEACNFVAYIGKVLTHKKAMFKLKRKRSSRSHSVKGVFSMRPRLFVSRGRIFLGTSRIFHIY